MRHLLLERRSYKSTGDLHRPLTPTEHKANTRYQNETKPHGAATAVAAAAAGAVGGEGSFGAAALRPRRVLQQRDAQQPVLSVCCAIPAATAAAALCEGELLFIIEGMRFDCRWHFCIQNQSFQFLSFLVLRYQAIYTFTV